ncbi:hypothetical protein N7537_011744 [Penicillium hordei]|uniref:Uncharacterized protein n=1 Tax=Penicillium hordei TaxID=40994 RepID=A0AAD6GS16_9EURO|nr:uncharacterized protein N7537_011744 [Penicillium hordei]KAJ5589066.1 hypothetical protein N7537_011744 [Penicillium hordei]
MLKDLQKPARPLPSDSRPRAGMYERYLHCKGRLHRPTQCDGRRAERGYPAFLTRNLWDGILTTRSMRRLCGRTFGGTGLCGWRRQHHSGGILKESLLQERFCFELIGEYYTLVENIQHVLSKP